MSDPERLDAIEEALMRLQTEIEQLDTAVRAQTQAHDELAARIDRLERRISRLEPDEDPGDEPAPDDGNHG
jgi:prefoldin subunit 5